MVFNHHFKPKPFWDSMFRYPGETGKSGGFCRTGLPHLCKNLGEIPAFLPDAKPLLEEAVTHALEPRSAWGLQQL